MDSNFCTSDPKSLKISKTKPIYYIPNPVDESFEKLKNDKNSNLNNDVFFAMSHGVHRGKLKKGKYDEREIFLDKLKNKLRNIDFDFFGYGNKEPIWANRFIDSIKNYDMGLNLSRGNPLKYYSSDRIVQIIGNGLLCLIDKKTQLSNIIPEDCAVYYKDINDLSKKIKFYKENIKLMKKIANKGKKFYNKNYNSTIVSQFFIDIIFNLKNKYEYLWYKK